MNVNNAIARISPDSYVRSAVDSVFESFANARPIEENVARLKTAIQMQITSFEFAKPEEPNNEMEIGRIFSPYKFIRFLAQPGIFFQPPKLYKDPNEGQYPSSVIIGHRKGLESYIRAKQEEWGTESSLAFSAFFPATVHQVLSEYSNAGYPIGSASCWTKIEAHGASELMWNTYSEGKNGVGIKTTYGRMKSILNDLLNPADGSDFITSGEVKYTLDDTKYHPAFRKRPQFSPEKEIRFFSHQIEGGGLFSLGEESLHAFQTFYSEDVDPGFEIQSDELIRRLCPRFFKVD